MQMVERLAILDIRTFSIPPRSTPHPLLFSCSLLISLGWYCATSTLSHLFLSRFPFHLSFLPTFSYSSSSLCNQLDAWTPSLPVPAHQQQRALAPHPFIMNMFETDYSNLFAAGLRVIESRSTDRTSLSAESQPSSSISPFTGIANRDQHPPLSSSSSSRKAFHYPTRLWRRPSPRNEKTSSADSSLSTARSKPARRRSLSGGVVEETALDVRIWDWSTRVSNATTILE
ncbi:hypothetical protein BJV74DRAFT_75084 [Russula compacta]|nr:hypothetical protein BJV74DRAFT_75084 [Russula compacta]